MPFASAGNAKHSILGELDSDEDFKDLNMAVHRASESLFTVFIISAMQQTFPVNEKNEILSSSAVWAMLGLMLHQPLTKIWCNKVYGMRQPS